jgi:hypothetical protein
MLSSPPSWAAPSYCCESHIYLRTRGKQPRRPETYRMRCNVHEQETSRSSPPAQVPRTSLYWSCWIAIGRIAASGYCMLA